MRRIPNRQSSDLSVRAGYPPATRRKLDALRLAVCALTLLTVSRIHQHFPMLSAARPAVVLAGCAFLYATLKPGALSGAAWFRTWPARVVAGLAILACLSALFGISFGASATTILEDFSKVLIFAFLLMATIRSARDLSGYVWAYVLSAGVLVWLSLFVFGLQKMNSNFYRLDALYSYDSNDVGVVLLVGLGLGVLTFQASRATGRLVSGVILVGIGVTLARSGSRGAFLGLLAVVVALLVLVRGVSVRKRAFFIGAIGVGLVLASPPGYWDQMKTPFHPTSDYNWTAPGGRKEVWLRGLEYMWSYPVFGLGIGNFARAEGMISERAKNWDPSQPGIKWSAPHNSFLEAGAELGLPGLVLWSWLVLGGIVAMYRLHRRLPQAWAGGDREQRFLYLATMYLPVSLTGFAVSGFFLSFAFRDPIYILAAYMTGVYVSVDRKLREAQTSSASTGANLSNNRPLVSGWRAGPARGQLGRAPRR